VKVGVAVAGFVGAVVVAGLGIVAVKVRRRSRRRRGSAAERVAGAWDEALDRLIEAGVALPVTATPTELAVRAGDAREELERPMRALAGVRSRACYAPDGAADADADAAWQAANEVAAVLDRGDSWAAQWRRRLDPRRLDPRRLDAGSRRADLGTATELLDASVLTAAGAGASARDRR
jgi:hypothetical protein